MNVVGLVQKAIELFKRISVYQILSHLCHLIHIIKTNNEQMGFVGVNIEVKARQPVDLASVSGCTGTSLSGRHATDCVHTWVRVAGHFSVRTFLSSWNLLGRTILSSLIFRAGHFSVRWFAGSDNSQSGHLSVGWFVGPVGSPTYGGSIVNDPFLTLSTPINCISVIKQHCN